MRMPREGRLPEFNYEIFQHFAEACYLDPWKGEQWTRPSHLKIPNCHRLPQWASRGNSTRSFAPGLIDPKYGELLGNRIAWPNINLQVTMFDKLDWPLPHRETRTEGPDAAMQDARPDAQPDALPAPSTASPSEDNRSVIEISSTAETSSPSTGPSSVADTNWATETRSTTVAAPDTEDTRSPTINAQSPNFGHVSPQRGIIPEEWTQWQAFMLDGITDEDRLNRLKAMHPPGVLLTKEEIENLFKSPLLAPSMEPGGYASEGEVDEIL